MEHVTAIAIDESGREHARSLAIDFNHGREVACTLIRTLMAKDVPVDVIVLDVRGGRRGVLVVHIMIFGENADGDSRRGPSLSGTLAGLLFLHVVRRSALSRWRAASSRRGRGFGDIVGCGCELGDVRRRILLLGGHIYLQ